MSEERLPPTVIRLTPPGRGAVASLRVEGAGSLEIVESHFSARDGRPLVDRSPTEIVLGHFVAEPCSPFAGDDQGDRGDRSARPRGEEVVVRRNGESVELHCHGGSAVVSMIENALIKAGCRSAPWQHWAMSSNDGQPSVSTCRDAWLALADARTERTAAILLDQYHGALQRELDAIRSTPSSPANMQRLDELLSRAPLGRHLTRPWRVVLAGRPNVGKSSLFNAIAGFGRAIVHHQPGTTRDAVSLTTAIDGWPIELCDTAGLRPTDNAIEQAGIALAAERLAAADLVVIVFDQSETWSNDDETLVARWPDAVLVHNKNDLPASCDRRRPGISISAARGSGIDAVLAEVSRRLVPAPPPSGAGVPFTDAQVEAIEGLRRDRQRWARGRVRRSCL